MNLREPHVCDCGQHAFIGLTRAGVALLDPEDMDCVRGRLWTLKEGYAKRTDYTANGKIQASMHREVAKAPSDADVDHANHDRSDNRKKNLRLCSHGQNMRNRNPWGGVRFKGVDYHKTDKVYRARITVRGSTKLIGAYKNPVDAALAYDAEAVRVHGAFAKTNQSMGLLNTGYPSVNGEGF